MSNGDYRWEPPVASGFSPSTRSSVWSSGPSTCTARRNRGSTGKLSEGAPALADPAAGASTSGGADDELVVDRSDGSLAVLSFVAVDPDTGKEPGAGCRAFEISEPHDGSLVDGEQQ